MWFFHWDGLPPQRQLRAGSLPARLSGSFANLSYSQAHGWAEFESYYGSSLCSQGLYSSVVCPGTMVTNMTCGILPPFVWTLLMPIIWLVSDELFCSWFTSALRPGTKKMCWKVENWFKELNQKVAEFHFIWGFWSSSACNLCFLQPAIPTASPAECPLLCPGLCLWSCTIAPKSSRMMSFWEPVLSDIKLDFFELSMWSYALKVPKKGMVVHCMTTEPCFCLFLLFCVLSVLQDQSYRKGFSCWALEKIILPLMAGRGKRWEGIMPPC